MRKRFIAALGVLFVSGLAAHGSAAPHADVTLSVSTYRNANGVLALVFSGAVSNAPPNQVVEIVGRDCGGTGFRLISSGRTRSGGGFEVENPERVFPYRSTPWQSGITFKARSSDKESEPYTLRLEAPLNVINVRGAKRKWRVWTSPPGEGTVSMKGKVVQLQRLRGATWKTIARKPLVYKPRLVNGSAFNHEAIFTVKQRGWRLRAILPAKHALPCYTTGISSQWRS
jgi:hypothetical protein